jgi:outer membrane protein assembly factor BamB
MRFLRFLAFTLALTFPSLHAADWPHWRGPNRDGKSTESSHFNSKAWPLTYPIWEANAGIGCSSMVVNAKGEMFTLGWSGGKDTLSCLNAATGRVKWKQSYPALDYARFSKGDKGFYRGPSSTPEFDPATGRLFTLGLDGDLQCWDTTRKGERVWSLNLYQQFGAPVRPQVTDHPRSHRDYGYPNSPVLHGDTLLVEVGAPSHGNLIAFDKATGKVQWKSENRDPAGHTGGVALMNVNGIPCAAVLTALNLVVTRLDQGHEGETMATYSWTTDYINNIATPTIAGNRVLITSQYNKKAVCCVEITPGRARKVWETQPGSGVCSPIVHKGRVYFVDRGLHCLDLKTGKSIWRGGKFDRTASILLTSDERLLVWANKGDLALVDANPRTTKYTELSLKRGILNQSAWPHVALAQGRVFCKDSKGNIKAYALSPEARNLNATRPATSTKSQPARKIDLAGWPGVADSLTLAWKQDYGKRRLDGSIKTSAQRATLTTSGDAAFGDAGELILSNGAVTLNNTAAHVLAAAQQNNELTLELIFQSASDKQRGPARVLSFSKDAYNRNFTLGQEGGELRLRLRTPRTGKDGSKPEVRLANIEPGKIHHLLVTYRDGQLQAYLNGRKTCDDKRVRGDFSNWTPQTLLLGNEANGGRAWRGSIHGVAIHNRHMPPREAEARYKATSR